jgi:hypothetical protein
MDVGNAGVAGSIRRPLALRAQIGKGVTFRSCARHLEGGGHIHVPGVARVKRVARVKLVARKRQLDL